MQKYNFNRQRLNFITWFRVFAVICILLCHYVAESSNPYIAMTAQFFNIGVSIFFIISGFCFGIQGEISECRKWYLKRMKRIYIPYEIFLLCLASVYMVKGYSLDWKNWEACILGMQGASVGVLGADHTWFITPLLLCYLVTPLLSKIWNEFGKVNIIKRYGLLLIFLGAHLILSLFPSPSAYIIISPIFFYGIAYIMGREYKKGNNIKMKWSTAIIAFGVMCAAFGVRILAKILWDGTILYDRIIVIYTQYLAAFAILLLFMFLFEDVQEGKICTWMNKVSFEIYLCHYMFVVGPISLIHLTDNLLINIFIVTGIVFVVAEILHRISGLFTSNKFQRS